MYIRTSLFVCENILEQRLKELIQPKIHLVEYLKDLLLLSLSDTPRTIPFSLWFGSQVNAREVEPFNWTLQERAQIKII